VTPESAYDEIHARLRRWPDIETHDLVAADQSDRLILAAAGELPADVTIVGDRYGAIALSILAAAPDTRIRLHQDPVTGERALAANAEDLGISLDTLSWHGLDETLTRGATLVVGQLPRGLGALDEIAGVIADHADPAVRVVLGGRQKHMTTSMNDVLRTHFDDMHVGRGVGKSRTLHATAPKKGSGEPWPRRAEHDGLTLVAHGAAFAGTDLDVGTRFLLTFLDRMPRTADAIDLGCGTGAIAASYALAAPGARVIASDRSAAAVSSAEQTMIANGVADRVRVVRDDGLVSQPDGSADLVLLNPPFHSGNAVTDEIAPRLFADAARVLRAGGELWVVWNSHLRYRPLLERIVGETRQIGRNSTFTVTASVRH